MLEQYLKQLGFNDKEITIYLCIVEHGKLSAVDISRITKINRTTVYSVSKELIKKRVIQEDLGGENRYYFALPIEDLEVLYKEEEEKLEKKKIATKELINKLAALPKSTQYSVPKIRFIDENHLRAFLFKQLPIWIESAKNRGDKSWWGFQDTSMIENYKDWFDYHWDVYPKDFDTHLITNKKPAETKFAKQINSKQRQMKYWGKSLEFSATHAVLGDYVVFIVTNQHPHYMVETHDAVMAKNLRELFKGMWDKI